MQQIRIESYILPDKESAYIADKKYQVMVNGKTVYFTNRKHVKAWLADLNRHLNLSMQALNRLTAEVFAEYRNYYFHLKTTERQRLATKFAAIDKTFNLILSRSTFRSGIGMCFDFLRNICNALMEIIELLEIHPMNRLATVQRTHLRCLKSDIETRLEKIYILPAQNEKK